MQSTTVNRQADKEGTAFILPGLIPYFTTCPFNYTF